MFWSNITEKGPKSALKVYYAFKLAWKHQFLIILCSFRSLNSKVSDILKFKRPCNIENCVVKKCYNGSQVYYNKF